MQESPFVWDEISVVSYAGITLRTAGIERKNAWWRKQFYDYSGKRAPVYNARRHGSNASIRITKTISRLHIRQQFLSLKNNLETKNLLQKLKNNFLKIKIWYTPREDMKIIYFLLDSEPFTTMSIKSPL